ALHRLLLRVRLGILERPEFTPRYFAQLGDGLGLGDADASVAYMVLLDALRLGETLTRSSVLQLMDALLVSGVCESVRTARVYMAEALAFGDMASGADVLGLGDGLEFGDAIAARITLFAQMIDALILSDADST